MSGDVSPDFEGNVLSGKVQVCSSRPCSQKLHVSIITPITPWHTCAKVTVVVLGVCVCLLPTALVASVFTHSGTYGFLLGISWNLTVDFRKCTNVPTLCAETT